MTKKTPILMMAALISLTLAQSATATQITGKVDMVGSLNLDTGNTATATAATSFGPAQVIPTPNGAFLGTAGSSVTFTPFSWNPQSTPVIPLWSFTSGGWTYTFDLQNISYVSQDSAFINLAGQGTLNITGLGSPFDPTPGSWTFTITSAGSDPEFNFGFVSSTAAVPDGGLTVALLGFALAGVEVMRRKLTK